MQLKSVSRENRHYWSKWTIKCLCFIRRKVHLNTRATILGTMVGYFTLHVSSVPGISVSFTLSLWVFVNLKHLLKSLIKNTRQYYETFLLHSIKEWTFPISKITSFLGFHSLVFTAIFNAIITFYILWHFTSLFNNYIYTGLSSLKILS